MIYQEHINKVMDRTGFPQEAKDCFNRVFDRIRNEPVLRKEYYALLHEYLYLDQELSLGKSLDKVTQLAAKYGENEYTMHLAFILSCTPRMYELYEEEGIDEEIYWESMIDLRCKLLECMECKGVPGTFVGGWFNGWFRLTRLPWAGSSRTSLAIISARPWSCPAARPFCPACPLPTCISPPPVFL